MAALSDRYRQAACLTSPQLIQPLTWISLAVFVVLVPSGEFFYVYIGQIL